MPKREDELLIQDMVDCFKNILNYTKDVSFDEFMDNKMMKDAVVRNFEIIGEAANILSEEFKSDNQQVEWRRLTDFRNKLIHHYFGLSYNIIWETVQNEAQEHLDFLETIEFEK